MGKVSLSPHQKMFCIEKMFNRSDLNRAPTPACLLSPSRQQRSTGGLIKRPSWETYILCNSLYIYTLTRQMYKLIIIRRRRGMNIFSMHCNKRISLSPEHFLQLKSFPPSKLGEKSSSTGSHSSFQQEQNNLRELDWLRYCAAVCPTLHSTQTDHFPPL